MEKTEHQWEQEVEEEEEEELLRGRKTQNGGTEITGTDDTNNTVTNGHSDENGRTGIEAGNNKVMNGHSDENGAKMQFSVPVNGAEELSVVQQGVAEEMKNSGDGGFDLIQQGVAEELDIRNGGFDDVEKLLRAESEDVNGNSERCVYFDHDKGIWKCRVCCWTHQSGSACTDIFQKSNGHLHSLMSVITENQVGVHFDFINESKGTTFANGVSITEQSSIGFSSFNPEKKPANAALEVNPPVNQIQPAEEFYKETGSDSETIDLNVEGVLGKQNTHDLFCPNCNSCITRRVILRKRKRIIRTSIEESKPKRIGNPSSSQSDYVSADPSDAFGTRPDPILEVEVNDDDRYQGPDIFRCLSCFSIFIPSDGGFRLFRMFGDKSKKGNIQDPEQLPAVRKNWFSSIFRSNKGESVAEQGTSQSASMTENYAGVQSSNGEASSSIPELAPTETLVTEHQQKGKNFLDSSAAPSNSEKPTVDLGDTGATNKGTIPAEMNMNGQKVNADISSHVPLYDEQIAGAALLTGNIYEDKNINVKLGQKAEKETPVSILGGIIMNEKVKTPLSTPPHLDNEQNCGEAALENDSVTQDGNKVVKLSDKDGTYHSEFSQQSTTTTTWDIYTDKPLNVDSGLFISSVQDASLLQDGRVDIAQILKDMPSTDNNAGNDMRITVDTEQVESTTSQQLTQDIIGSPQTEDSPCVDTLIGVADQSDPTARNIQRRLDIIKSIVYGGLIESVTSLGVISSAAGANASTVNVLALGLANLIGGLFVIGHDLWEVKESQRGGASNRVEEQVDRYQEVLGSRSDFTLHAVIAIISYIIFGLIPPVIYGFSFRQSNDRDLKLLVVTIGSLVCIILLAIGKAYVRRQPKSYFKTMMYYVVIGAMSSGASYVAGSLIMRLLEKLGLFEPSQGFSLTETGSVKQAWASY